MGMYKYAVVGAGRALMEEGFLGTSSSLLAHFVFFVTVTLPWESGFRAVLISQKSLLLVRSGKLLEGVFLPLLILVCLQLKIILMSTWHVLILI